MRTAIATRSEAQVFNANGTPTTGIITVNSSPTPSDYHAERSPRWRWTPTATSSWPGSLEPPLAARWRRIRQILLRHRGPAIHPDVAWPVGNEFKVAGQTAVRRPSWFDPTVAMNSNSFVIGWQQGGGSTFLPDRRSQAQRYSVLGDRSDDPGRLEFDRRHQPRAGHVRGHPLGSNGHRRRLRLHLGSIPNAASELPAFRADLTTIRGRLRGSLVLLFNHRGPRRPTSVVAMNGAGHFAIAY